MPGVLPEKTWMSEEIVSGAQPAASHKLILARTDQHVAWRGNAIPDNPVHIVDKLLGRTARHETQA